MNILNPGKRFIAWLTRAQQRQLYKTAFVANASERVKEIADHVKRRGEQDRPDNPAYLGDYILAYGRPNDIIALAQARGVVLNKKGKYRFTNKLVRPTERLCLDVCQSGAHPYELERLIAARALVDFDRKAIEYAGKSYSDLVNIIRFAIAAVDTAPCDKENVLSVLKRVEQKRAQGLRAA